MTVTPKIDPIDLRDLVGDVLDVDPDAITEDVHFIRDLGVDSLLALELAVTLERRYGVKIESHEMAEIETMTDVRALLQSKVPSRGMSDPRPAGRFLLVDTQSGAASARFHEDGLVLARAGNDVSLVLSADAVEAGVGVLDPRLAAFITAGGRVLVDDFTLAHRGLSGVPPAPGVAYTGMAQVAELVLAPDVRVVWH